jgi:hypothetical protein
LWTDLAKDIPAEKSRPIDRESNTAEGISWLESLVFITGVVNF